MPSGPLNRFFSPAQCARYYGVISRRYSCRAYAAAPDAGELAALNYAAARVCLPGTRIVLADCTDQLFFGVPLVERIRGARKCAYVIAQDGMEKPKLLAGVSGEAFVLEAAAMGLDTCWVTGTYRRGEVPQEMLSDGERLIAVIALGHAKETPQQIVRHRKSLSQICLDAPDQWPLWAYRAAEAVRIAPSAVNRQPWRLAYAQRSLRLMGKNPDNVDLGIALMHIEAASGEYKRYWEWGSGGCVAHLTIEEKS